MTDRLTLRAEEQRHVVPLGTVFLIALLTARRRRQGWRHWRIPAAVIAVAGLTALFGALHYWPPH
ncbi:MAG: hypothetical protein J2P48_08120 [Alphaproteobacteria bacterium]|nr:hypothetical protein [Alphaproteobacteria bacterium]